MPSLEHEFPLDLIRHSPDLAAVLLAHTAQMPLPEYTRARCDSGDTTTTAPPELRADSVVVCERASGSADREAEPVLAIIIECQTGHDRRKRFSWPAYTANLRARLECGVILLVLTPDEALARWCAEPIDLGGGFHVQRPLTLPLSALRPVTDPEIAAAHPELAILAAAVHRTEDTAALDALLPAFAALDHSKTTLYSDYVLAALPAAARKYLEDTVTAGTYEFKTELIGRPYREGKAEGMVEGKAEGKAEGEATALLAVLDARGIPLDDHTREHIRTTTDLDLLTTWIRRAATATATDDLFG